jgi:hypothetical protein
MLDALFDTPKQRMTYNTISLHSDFTSFIFILPSPGVARPFSGKISNHNNGASNTVEGILIIYAKFLPCNDYFDLIIDIKEESLNKKMVLYPLFFHVFTYNIREPGT